MSAMTVWREQDRLWRLAAVLGLLAAVNGGVLFIAAMSYVTWGGHSDDPPARGLDTPTIAELAVRSLLIVGCWVSMLRWRQMGCLWAALWAALRAHLLVPIVYPATPPPHVDLEDLVATFALSALLASQFWVGWDAHAKGGLWSSTRDTARPGHLPSVWRKAGWPWRLLALAGLATALYAVAPSVYEMARWTLWTWDMRTPNSIYDVGLVVVNAGLAVLVISLWFSLAARGRGSMLWFLMWSLTLGGFLIALAMYIGERPANIYRVAGPGSLLMLLMGCQIWVAWKAHQVRGLPAEAAQPSQ